MPLFDAEHRLRSDPCALQKTVDENRRAIQWQLANARRPAGLGGNACAQPAAGPAATEHVAQNRNLQPWDGYGINACTVDADSLIRYDDGKLTHDRCRQQLQNRVFLAVPSLQRGTVLPGLESRIQAGADTSSLRVCDRITEKAFDVFHPALLEAGQEAGPCLTWGADLLASSRDIARSDEFLASMGYEHDAYGWRRA